MDEIVIDEWGTTEVMAVQPEVELFALDGPDQELIFVGDVGIQGPPGPQGPTGPQGPPGTGGTGAWGTAPPTQSPDGTRKSFTLPVAYVTGSLRVHLNGLLESHVTELSTTTFQFADAPFAGDEILAFYNAA